MATLSENLQTLATKKEELRLAINNKGGLLPNNAKFSQFAQAVTDLPTGGTTGGGGADETDVDPNLYRVRFIDYDGTVLKSEFVADGEGATAPNNPSHDGLVFEGWNIAFNEITSYTDVGAMYTTESGWAEFDIEVNQNTGLIISFYPFIESGVLSVNWGVGGTAETFEFTGRQGVVFAYEDFGKYTVRMKISEGGSWYIPQYFVNGGSGEDTHFLQHARITDVKKINNKAFYHSKALKTVVLCRGVERLESEVFYECFMLQAMVLPDTVNYVSDACFYNCIAMTKFVLSDGLESIPYKMCRACHTLDCITIPEGVQTLSQECFCECWSLEYATLPSSLRTIKTSAFHDCWGLRKVTFRNGLQSVGQYAFYNCYNLNDVILPNTLTSMGSQIFYDCRNLKEINIPTGLTSVSVCFCQFCRSLERVTIPHGVTTLGSECFNACYTLKEITIPDSVTSIGSGAFYSCYALDTIKMQRTSPPVLGNTNVFGTLSKTANIIIPRSENRTVFRQYILATNWSAFANNMVESDEEEIIEEVTE